jgi:mannose-6-phosphate isomerase
MPSSAAHQRLLVRETDVVEALRFRPFLRPSPWGGRTLAERYGKLSDDDDDITFYGESWEISGHPLHVSQVIDGHFAGRTLNELWSEQAEHWSAAQDSPAAEFPLLIKLLDCRQPCSVQVHPGMAGSAAMEPPQSVKIEAWVVLESLPDAVIYAGLRPDVSEADIRHALATGSIVECLHAVTPRVGDCFLMTPGIVHAMQGVVLAEFQTTSDATLRLFDWNRTDQDGRPRKLHIEESIREIDFARGPVPPVAPRPLLADDGVDSEVLVEIPEFRLTRHRLGQQWNCPPYAAFSIWMVAAGAVSVTVNDQPPGIVRRGETLLIPPCERLVWTSVEGSSATLLQCERP